jgi:hypothetical protein
MCLHCGYVQTEMGDEQSLVLRQRRIRDKIYHLKMTSYAVMAVFLGAFSWYWWDSAGFVQPSSAGPFVLMGLSGLAYMIVRALVFQAQRKQKELKRVIGRGLSTADRT